VTNLTRPSRRVVKFYDPAREAGERSAPVSCVMAATSCSSWLRSQVPRALFTKILLRIDDLRPNPAGEVRP
jgi:hypothetical protein